MYALPPSSRAAKKDDAALLPNMGNPHRGRPAMVWDAAPIPIAAQGPVSAHARG